MLNIIQKKKKENETRRPTRKKTLRPECIEKERKQKQQLQQQHK